MLRISSAFAALLFSTAALAVQFTGVQTSATTWTYTLTYDPQDNYSVCQPGTTITITGLTGVTAAGPPTSTTHPAFPAVQLQWTAQVLGAGTLVVWTHVGGGTGNSSSRIYVFGFSITANAQNGAAPFSTSGFARDVGCSPPSPLDIAGTVTGPTGTQPPLRVLPVVGSTPGDQGSFFKTSVQLYNPRGGVTATGRIVYHVQGVSGSSADPSLQYSIQSGRTVTYADLLPAMGVASGLGSADLIPDFNSPLPISTVRVFNDAGAKGTSGLTEEQMISGDALQKGGTAALIAPADMQKFRLNIGVRTLDQGATIDITVRDKNGATVKTTTKTYGATFFTQVGSTGILDGYALTGGETISFKMTSGSAFIYGATTDNITNDPSVQFARRID